MLKTKPKINLFTDENGKMQKSYDRGRCRIPGCIFLIRSIHKRRVKSVCIGHIMKNGLENMAIPEDSRQPLPTKESDGFFDVMTSTAKSDIEFPKFPIKDENTNIDVNIYSANIKIMKPVFPFINIDPV